MAIWLNEADVRALLSMRELIGTVEQAVVAFSAGCARQPVRTVIDIPGGFFATMPALLETSCALGAKLVTVCNGNAAKGLDSHLATILLLDPDTGETLAIMDGRYITEARTAAASAVAVRYLAQAGASSLGILGSGVQARSHLEALPAVRDFTEIRAWSPTPSRLHEFVAESDGRVRPAASAWEAVEGADVILLATSSPIPVIENPWVKPGACVISVGACRPTQREMDPELVARARLFTDTRAAALQESGDIVQGIREGRFAEDHIAAELGELVANPALGRGSDDEVTVFKSLGIAVEDVATADRVYRRARESGRGVRLD
jgi:ornithine cyclodeaminase/alanine dehydrogenase-like protein (mu-crystallin family)